MAGRYVALKVVFVHPVKPGHLTVPHPKSELGKGLLNKLLKQAGLKL